MSADLVRHIASDEAFRDRLPYVLDLLAGVRRHLNDAIPPDAGARQWWASQWTSERQGVTQLRHSQLKSLESSEEPRGATRTNMPSGLWRGHNLNAGDTVAWRGWQFVDGYFAGLPVLEVLGDALTDASGLIEQVRRAAWRMD